MIRLAMALALADSLFETRESPEALAKIKLARALADEIQAKAEHKVALALIERVAAQA